MSRPQRRSSKPRATPQGSGPVRIAIVGRPNVGKSTLFNRLLGRRRAITMDEPGITRDPIIESVDWDGPAIDLVDTGGLGGEAEIALADQVHEHTVRAIAASDLLVVLFDAKAGCGPLDRDTADLVQRSGLPAVYVANKGEGRLAEEGALEFCALGIDPPLVVSAEHGLGITGLRRILEAQATAIAAARAEQAGEDRDGDAAAAAAETQATGGDAAASEAADGEAGNDDEDDNDVAAEDAAVRPCRIALVGRPNVGKSSFLNLLAGQELSLVDNRPGTTRDVVDTEIEREGRRYVLLDTAGMRRPSRVVRGVEKISVRRSLDAIERADVVVLLVEPEEGVTDQDARIARHAWEEGRALVLLVNKIDLSGPAELAHVEAAVRDVYPTLSPVPVGRLSVKKGFGVDAAFDLIDRAWASHNRRLTTPEINRLLAEATRRREPPVLGRGRAKFFYATQTAVRPPTISVFTNRVALPEDYVRFLERCFREEMDFTGSPLRLRFVRRDSHGGRDPGEAPPKERRGRDRRGMKSTGKPAGKKPSKPTGKPPGKAPGKPAAKPAPKRAAKPVGQSAGKTAGKPGAKAAGKPSPGRPRGSSPARRSAR